MAVNRCDYCHEPITFRDTACLCYGDPDEDVKPLQPISRGRYSSVEEMVRDLTEDKQFAEEIIAGFRSGPADDDDDSFDSDLDDADCPSVVDPSKEPTDCEPTVADPPGVPVG